MRKLLARITRILLSVPRMIMVGLDKSGRAVFDFIRAPFMSPEPEGIFDEVAQGLADQRDLKPTSVEATVRGYCKALLTDDPGHPSLAHMIDRERKWTYSLTKAEARILLATKAGAILRHIDWHGGAGLIPGVRTIHGNVHLLRPAPVVAKVSETVDDEKTDPFVESLLDEILAEEDMHETGERKVVAS